LKDSGAGSFPSGFGHGAASRYSLTSQSPISGSDGKSRDLWKLVVAL